MKKRCPTARVIGRTEIEDYELVFKGSKSSAVATIEPCEGSIVPVLIWDIKDEDEKALDRYIRRLENFKVIFEDGKLYVYFKAVTIYGEMSVDGLQILRY